MYGVDPVGSRRIEPAHVGRAAGVWVVTYKKRSGGPYASYDNVVEEALCFGWIDSVRRSLDADRSQLLVTPRKRGSRWFKANIQRLTAAGRLAPAGLAAVTDAKADGSWTALDAVEELVEPEDLGAALDAEPDARANWDGFHDPPSGPSWNGSSLPNAPRRGPAGSLRPPGWLPRASAPTRPPLA